MIASAFVRRGAIVAASLLYLVVFPQAASAGVVEQASDDRTLPNVVLIVTDDQRWDTIDLMPTVSNLLAGRGTTFEQAFVVNPLCCPSRASILTGNYSHTTGVYQQGPPHGGFEAFDDSSTLATWLSGRGYETGLFGKYIDSYQHDALIGYVPPGWSRWQAFVHSQYVDYSLTHDGTIVRYGDEPADYATTVLGDAAEEFIRQADAPFFVEFAPPAPHAPAVVEAQYAKQFADLPPWRPPSFNEASVEDKPAYMRALPPLTPDRIAALDWRRRLQLESLLSVDREVGDLLTALQETGHLDDTIVIYTSDNGVMLGEHRWDKKEVPYEESIRVPLIVRDDSLAVGPSVDDHLVLNIDIAPTIAERAGVDVETDGVSLMPLLRRDASVPWRTRFLVEHLERTNPVPTYCAIRTEQHVLVEYVTGERELYDLVADPYQLENVAGTPATADLQRALSRDLAVLCDPRPPGPETSRSTWIGVGLLTSIAGLTAVTALASRRRKRPGTASRETVTSR
ncbi:MAG TPA: sulfatase [Actinomycetota bacterium]